MDQTAKPLHIKQDIFTIEAPSEFTGYTQIPLYSLITNTIKVVTNKEYQVEVVIKDTQNESINIISDDEN